MVQLACLHSDDASLVLEPQGDGVPVWRHCGALVDPSSLPSLADVRGPASFSLDVDVPLSTIPGSQPGWFGPSALEIRDERGLSVPFRPGRTLVEHDPDSIQVTARDAKLGLTFEQSFLRLPGGAFLLQSRLENTSDATLQIASACSAILPLAGKWDRIVSWRGRHNAELAEQTEQMPAHRWSRETRRGISGHGGPPGVYVLEEGTGRDNGLVLALQLAWSGDSRIAVERDDEGHWVLGASSVGERTLGAGEALDLPGAILAISLHGRNGAMAQQHAAVRSLVRWPGGTMRPRPVHLNSWEACYFNFDEARIAELAQAAAEIGVERFVLDDGWFKGRRNDRAGLGDWTCDPGRFPEGLGPLIDRVNALGMEFGLWVEPEMVNPDSDLYRAHPDWVIAESESDRPTARGQLVLDLRRPEVREHLFGAISQLLRDHPIAYLKWDHNRDHAPSGGPAQVLGTYELLARLRAAHPDVEIEGCAGGGGRSDVGLARYVHRFWTSDNIDAVARIGMQRGFVAFLPPEMMGSHIGASPSHTTGRRQSLAFRAAIACMGHLGVEMNPARLSEADHAEMPQWLSFYKQWRHLLHGGETFLGEGTDGLRWQAQGRDDEFVLFAIRSSPALDRRPQPLSLPFAARGKAWDVRLLTLAETSGRHRLPQPPFVETLRDKGSRLSGSWLAANGLPLPAQLAESVAIYHLKVAG